VNTPYVPVVFDTPEELARLIDHTLLKTDVTHQQVVQACQEARRYGFASVITNPVHIGLCAQMLHGSDVKVGCPVSFPTGADLPEMKAYQAESGIQHGATEVDMIVNVGALKDGRNDVVEREMRLVAEVCHRYDFLCKVVLETAYLTDDEKVTACRLAMAAGMDFVKTSTAFGCDGATVADVLLMRRTVGPDMGVKASGGIRSLQDVQSMLEAGANRIGCSASVNIVEEAARLLQK
jgi:deoxyribose-phosphate aldolase